MNLKRLLPCIAVLTSLPGFTVNSMELNIATVNNGHMIEMQKLSSEYEKLYPDVKLKWHVFKEGSLRMRVIADIAAETGNYDVVTIGMYETPIWAQRNWLTPLEPSAKYDLDDLLPAVRDGLSLNDNLYAAPFYGESSITMYRKDLLEKHGLAMSERPTWEQVRDIAAKIHDPENGVYGICLRGKPGWGDNMALVTTMVNGFGGQWFDMDWNPQINSRQWQDAVSFYIDLLRDYGPENSVKNSFNEILSLSREGKCGIWVDASIAASFISDKSKSDIADEWHFAQAPYQVTKKGANWLWAWALAIPKGSKKLQAAQDFISWATSKEYIELVAKHNGWSNVPTGTRQSTYENQEFLKVAGKFANSELHALSSADPIENTFYESPYQGIQYVSIPEFISIGGITAQKVAEALDGKIGYKQALDAAQKIAERKMHRGGYFEEASEN
ncbi:sugar ABC transporter substrate-binding protein [Vibrio sp. JC009]|uniref:ABC transporter substrate-binding protein n=1 Tax=Vibrio sp. JC009 TaxID=2912314 RepID=UPI0023AF2631|nr:sugar ABC transporter substrate-binding protein [Vibrio sp. JC009]WED23945.1 sugar ABC transporter substrate-binding protein [Vibrio sp. JC009]